MKLRLGLTLLTGAFLFTADAGAAERVLLAPAGAGIPALAARSGSSLPAPLPAIAKETAPGTIARLRAAAARDGQVRVIVGYKVPFAAEAELNPTQVEQQRQEIAAAADRLRTRYGAAGQAGGIETFDSIPFATVTVTQNQLGQLLNDPDILTVTEDVEAKPQLTHSVPFIGVPGAWKAGATGKGQVVAIIDYGTETSHPFLRDRMAGTSKVIYEASVDRVCIRYTSTSGYCGDVLTQGPGTASKLNPSYPSHGTAVAGIIVGQRPASGSDPELSGVAPDARLMAFRVQSGFSSELIKALAKIYELRGQYNIAAVNTSMGLVNFSAGTCDAYWPALAAIIGNLRAAGIPTVAPAGNNASIGIMAGRTGTTDRLLAPACISSAISVGAVTASLKSGPVNGQVDDYAGKTFPCSVPQPIKVDEVACFSNTSPELSFLAPGFPIDTSTVNGSYGTLAGTSAAAPHVAGAIAVLRSGVPAASVEQILDALRITGKQIRDYRTGLSTPRIDVARALAYLQAGGKPAIGYTSTGDGLGMVSFSPAGSLAFCSANCTSAFAPGTRVTMTARPSPGMQFLGWNSEGGECQGTSPICTLTIGKQVTLVSAGFGKVPAPASYKLSYARGGAGGGTLTASVNGAQLPCIGASCSTTQPGGTLITLAARPDDGSTFAGWSGACTGTAPSCSFALRADSTVTASFEKQAASQVSLLVTSAGKGTLSARLNGQSVACTVTGCTATGAPGSVLTVTATPAEGAMFAGWSGVCSGSAPTCNVTLSTNGRIAMATFKPRPGSLASAR